MTLDAYVLQAIRNVMSPQAEIQVMPVGAGVLNFDVSWGLSNDPTRPNKRSKTISIAVSREAFDDFSTTSTNSQKRAYDLIDKFLAASLAAFDPQHNTPIENTPLAEQWIMTSGVLGLADPSL
jgi:hypothetical protein